MLVGGELRAARSGASIDAYNPATGELFARFPRGDAADVDDAVAAAQSAFRAWWATPPLDRAACLQRLAALIEEHAQELAMLDVIDNGSPIREMRKRRRHPPLASSATSPGSLLSSGARPSRSRTGDSTTRFAIRSASSDASSRSTTR